jgi:hypothetical protein
VSADNGYLIRQRKNSKWVAQHVFLSTDDWQRLNLYQAGLIEYLTLEDCIGAYKEAISETEYGVVGIEYNAGFKFKIRSLLPNTPSEVQPIEVIVTVEHADISIQKVYATLHELGFHGELAISIVEGINAKGVMFVEKPKVNPELLARIDEEAKNWEPSQQYIDKVNGQV